jgi:hypothetical protein
MLLRPPLLPFPTPLWSPLLMLLLQSMLELVLLMLKLVLDLAGAQGVIQRRCGVARVGRAWS